MTTTYTISSAVIDRDRAVPVRLEARAASSAGLHLRFAGKRPDAADERLLRESTVRVRSVLGDRFAPFAVEVEIHAPSRPTSGQLAGLDLPIALVAAAVIRSTAPVAAMAHGDLSLGGQVRAARGAYLVAELGQAQGTPALLAPASAYMPPHYYAARFEEALAGGTFSSLDSAEAPAPAPDDLAFEDAKLSEDGHRRLAAALVAGVGVTLYGRPGSGIVLLARRLGLVLPEITGEERRRIRRVYSAALAPAPAARPFRAPHHTASTAALSGTLTGLGETDLAVEGVLHLGDLHEFRKSTLEDLAQHFRLGARPRPALLVAGIYDEATAGDLARVEPFRAAHCPVWITLTGRGTSKTAAEVRQAVAEALARPEPLADGTASALAVALARLDGAERVTSAHEREARDLVRPSAKDSPQVAV